MKNYTITVNGNVYEVTVEEGAVNTTSAVSAPVAPAASTVAPKAVAPAVAPKVATNTGAAGSVKVNAPMPGKILALKVDAGQAVKKGDVILILEAMKMENEIVAPSDGSIASMNVAVGSTVEAGDVLATLN